MNRTSQVLRGAALVAAITLPLVLSACGGGSSSSNSGNNASESVALSVDSHADNQTITGNRTITLTWTTNKSGTTRLTHNGTPVTVSGNNGSYSASLTLANNDNVVAIEAKDAAGNTLNKTLHLSYPFIALTSGQAASVVIGQPDFSTSLPAATQSGIKSPYGNPAVHNGTLYLPDYANSRILGFNTLPTTNGALADFVWGQPDFVTAVGAASSGTAADRLRNIESVVISGDKAFVADYGNNRLLIWNTIPASTSGYITADVVVGQPDATTTTSTCSQKTITAIESVFVAGSKLIVPDGSCHRVLIWNTIPTTTGAPADLVLGQSDFVSHAANRGGAAGADSLNYPADAWSDGTRLFVTDYMNNRVLIWNTFPTRNGQPADAVLGQPDLTTVTPSAGSTGMYAPYYINSNGNQLFVADGMNRRVLVWDALPSTSGVAADHVIGQPDFTTVTAALGADRLSFPTGLTSTGDRLIVLDAGNSRALIYQGN